jgi:hypothetical protein
MGGRRQTAFTERREETPEADRDPAANLCAIVALFGGLVGKFIGLIWFD